ncbi:MAG: hypothetical protein K2G88_03660 [Oscillospiraceae bacterium]|nr:hypothetical protein [Oscillospiraceae bacterium]
MKLRRSDFFDYYAKLNQECRTTMTISKRKKKEEKEKYNFQDRPVCLPTIAFKANSKYYTAFY